MMILIPIITFVDFSYTFHVNRPWTSDPPDHHHQDHHHHQVNHQLFPLTTVISPSTDTDKFNKKLFIDPTTR